MVCAPAHAMYRADWTQNEGNKEPAVGRNRLQLRGADPVSRAAAGPAHRPRCRSHPYKGYKIFHFDRPHARLKSAALLSTKRRPLLSRAPGYSFACSRVASHASWTMIAIDAGAHVHRLGGQPHGLYLRLARWQCWRQRHDPAAATAQADFRCDAYRRCNLRLNINLFKGNTILLETASNKHNFNFDFYASRLRFRSLPKSIKQHEAKTFKFVDFKMLSLHSERLADIVLEPPEAEVPNDGRIDHLAPRIEPIDVGFRYSESDPWVMRHVNLVIEPGDSVALIGPSGGGKTTLVKLMLNVLAPSEGEIRYGGLPISQLGQRVGRHGYNPVRRPEAANIVGACAVQEAEGTRA